MCGLVTGFELIVFTLDMTCKNDERFTVRNAEYIDLAEVVKLSEENGFAGWKREDYKNLINREDSIVLVALAEDELNCFAGKVVGFLFVRLLENEGEILTFAVDKEFRRLGVASMLFERFLVDVTLNGVKRIFLEVRESNAPAIQFYLAKGFKQIGLRPLYYSNPPGDAALMVLSLY